MSNENPPPADPQTVEAVEVLIAMTADRDRWRDAARDGLHVAKQLETKLDKIKETVEAQYSLAQSNYDYYDRESRDFGKSADYQKQCGAKRDIYEREKAVWSHAVRLIEGVLNNEIK